MQNMPKCKKTEMHKYRQMVKCLSLKILKKVQMSNMQNCEMDNL